MEEVTLVLKSGEVATGYRSACGCVFAISNNFERWVKFCDYHRVMRDIVVVDAKRKGLGLDL